MLFDDCIEVILTSIVLVKNAAKMVPQKMAQHILFVACHRKNYSIIQAMLSSWPHPEVSFDFMSNTLCRRYQEMQESCIDVQEYFNIKCSEAYGQCIPSVALGIFYNILGYQNRNVKFICTEINLNKICIAEKSSVAIILKLVEGHYPVSHPSDYVSASDKKAIPLTKPELASMTKKITLSLNVKITTMSTFRLLQKTLSYHNIFNTVITKISLCSSLSRSHISEMLSFFSGHYYSNICYSPSMVSATQAMPSLLPGGCLRLSFSNPLNDTTSVENVLHCLSKPSTIFVENYLHEVFILLKNAPLIAFGVLPDIENSDKKIGDCLESLKLLLHSNATCMKYLQLNRFPTALIGQLELTALRNLKVLSIASKTIKTKSISSPTNQMCTVLKYLEMLEYFSWTDGINIFSKELILIYETLKSSLPRLAHWHMSSFKVVLFTNISPAERKKVAYIYDHLMEGKSGNEVCSTYKFSLDSIHFKVWLAFARPDVCFNFKLFPT